MKIIKKLEEKRRLNFEYKKDIENVKRKHGRYVSPTVKNLSEAGVILFGALFIWLSLPLFSANQIIKVNSDFENHIDYREAVMMEVESIEKCSEDVDNKEKAQCISKNLNSFEYMLSGVLVTKFATEHALETRDTELAKHTLDTLKELEISRHYADYEMNTKLGIATSVINNSTFGNLYKKVKGENVFDDNINEDIDKKINSMSEELRAGLNLHDYNAVITGL